MYASRRSDPPKQMFVVSTSGKPTCSYSPVGEKIVMPPLKIVAEQICPLASTARLSSGWCPGSVQTMRPRPLLRAG